MPPNPEDILIKTNNKNKKDITPAYLSTYKGEVIKLKYKLKQLS
jgi:hypothetical protein